MWYWGAHGMQHVGRVIIVGGDPRAVRRLGFTPASTMDDALEMATDVVGPPPHHHPPAHPAAPDGGRALGARRWLPARPGLPAPLKARRAADRAVRGVRRTHGEAQPAQRVGRLPLPPAHRAPRRRRSRRRSRRSGADYDTEWARRRAGPRRPGRSSRTGRCGWPCRCWPSPEVRGVDRLADLRGARHVEDGASTPPAVIFTPNHHSHLDTPLAITAIPEPWRAPPRGRRGRRLLLHQPPHQRGVGPRAQRLPGRPATSPGGSRPTWPASSSTTAGACVIFPEGGRSPDGWGQPFKGGAAFLSIRTGAPVVPVFIEGTGSILGKGMKRPKPGKTTVTFGAPLWPEDGREHPPLQRPHRAGRHRARRRDADGLVVGPPAGRGRHQPRPDRPGAHGLAPGLGPLRAPEPRARPACAAARSAAGPSWTDHRPPGASRLRPHLAVDQAAGAAADLAGRRTEGTVPVAWRYVCARSCSWPRSWARRWRRCGTGWASSPASTTPAWPSSGSRTCCSRSATSSWRSWPRSQEGTTAGRTLERRGGAGGYMVMVQCDDLDRRRARLAGLGVRVVWQGDLEDIRGTHLHPQGHRRGPSSRSTRRRRGSRGAGPGRAGRSTSARTW